MTIAALYVDTKRGPYPDIPGVDCWGIERDATRYAGPWPVVAHPPCGHWGRYWYRAHDDGHTGPIAVTQVRRWGGVLGHPQHSKLWRHCGLPDPEALPDEFGGWTLRVRQHDWGHRADKWTWLYIVGASSVPPLPPRRPALPPNQPRPSGSPGTRGQLELMAKSKRHLTPIAFAEWLVDLARMCCQPACAVDSRGGTMDTAGKVLTHPPAAEHDARWRCDDA